jgi:hypothetical protein
MNYKIAFKLENGKTQFSPWLMKDDPQGAIDHAKSYVNVHHAISADVLDDNGTVIFTVPGKPKPGAKK